MLYSYSMIFKKRAIGTLLPISSLPSPAGVGDLGPEAIRFVDLLSKSNQKYWQILPLTPVEEAGAYSPYSSPSAFAGNFLLIHLQIGTVKKKSHIDYKKVGRTKSKELQKIFKHWRRKIPSQFWRFKKENHYWLDDYALFMAIRHAQKEKPWTNWPLALKNREAKALEETRRVLTESILFEEFVQFLFDQQWQSLRSYAHRKRIKIIGDMPIYVNQDSADVWANQELFDLKSDGGPVAVSGVPPDYFSKKGQRWGNPLYRWNELQKTGYDWWLKRFKRNAALYDCVRIDHFRGLVAYWRIPALHKTAKKGHWVKVPVVDFLKTVRKKFPDLSIIAEDLGLITPDVRKVMKQFKLPGMRVLQFGFDGDPTKNINHPSQITKDCVVYTGTHDNNTTRGWFEEEASPQAKKRLAQCLGEEPNPETISALLIKVALLSKAHTVIIPLQDYLGLPSRARINKPARPRGNWTWKLV